MLLHNMIHEFSHSYCKELKNNIGDKLNDKKTLKKLDYLYNYFRKETNLNNEEILKSYNNPAVYYEEQFIRISTFCFLMYNLFQRNSSIENILSDLQNRGFLFSYDLYSEIKKYKDGKSKYERLEDLYIGAINTIYTKYKKLPTRS